MSGEIFEDDRGIATNQDQEIELDEDEGYFPGSHPDDLPTVVPGEQNLPQDLGSHSAFGTIDVANTEDKVAKDGFIKNFFKKLVDAIKPSISYVLSKLFFSKIFSRDTRTHSFNEQPNFNNDKKGFDPKEKIEELDDLIENQYNKENSEISPPPSYKEAVFGSLPSYEEAVFNTLPSYEESIDPENLNEKSKKGNGIKQLEPSDLGIVASIRKQVSNKVSYDSSDDHDIIKNSNKHIQNDKTQDTFLR